MPANNEEVEGAEEEGVKFQFLANPVKINAVNGKAGSIECVRMALGEADASGRRRPEPVSGSEFPIEINAVIMAVGQTIDASGLGQGSAVKLSRRGGIDVKADTLETAMPGVFAGGDCTSSSGYHGRSYRRRYATGLPI